jgi:DNA-binding transcriptional regulator YdaS (Cro superfamily)
MNLLAYVSTARGCQSDLARQVRAQPQLVWQWANGVRQVPADRCPEIERATAGRVTAEELRPDVAWRRIRDGAWRWHPDGKPLVDVMPTQPAPLEQSDA